MTMTKTLQLKTLAGVTVRRAIRRVNGGSLKGKWSMKAYGEPQTYYLNRDSSHKWYVLFFINRRQKTLADKFDTVEEAAQRAMDYHQAFCSVAVLFDPGSTDVDKEYARARICTYEAKTGRTLKHVGPRDLIPKSERDT